MDLLFNCMEYETGQTFEDTEAPEDLYEGVDETPYFDASTVVVLDINDDHYVLAEKIERVDSDDSGKQWSRFTMPESQLEDLVDEGTYEENIVLDDETIEQLQEDIL